MNVSPRKGFGLRVGCLALIVVSPICVFLLYFGYLPYSSVLEIEEEAQAGHIPAQMWLSHYYSGSTGDCLMLYHGRFVPDKGKALYWIETAERTAALQAPGLYRKDVPEIGDDDLVKLYILAASRGSSTAATRLCTIYTYGQLGQPRDPKKAAYWHALVTTNAGPEQ